MHYLPDISFRFAHLTVSQVERSRRVLTEIAMRTCAGGKQVRLDAGVLRCTVICVGTTYLCSVHKLCLFLPVNEGSPSCSECTERCTTN